MKALPDEFLLRLRNLETLYCATSDPILQSGFSGGADRWRDERSPILEAIQESGDFLDIGCANGYLLECLVKWGAEQGTVLVPHGIDINPKLIDMTIARLPTFSKNFHVGNAWDYQPVRQYNYVYSVWDCVPESYFAQYCHRLLDKFVKPNGTLILGMYGSRSRKIPPIDLGDRLSSLGFRVAGKANGGNPSLTSFAWINV